MGTCKLCNVRHPSFYCRKQDILDKQARKLQKLVKEQFEFQIKIEPNYSNTSLAYILKNLIEESEK